MCGISGIFLSGTSDAPLRDVMTRMSDQLLHRGPDDSGTWVDEPLAWHLATAVWPSSTSLQQVRSPCTPPAVAMY